MTNAEPAQMLLSDVALAALADYAQLSGATSDNRVDALNSALPSGSGPPRELLEQTLAHPATQDVPLVRLSERAGLRDAELLCAAIARRVESDAQTARLLTWLQAPVGGPRPTLGLLAGAFTSLDGPLDPSDLAAGKAAAIGLYNIPESTSPLPDRAVVMPPHLLLASRGRPASVPGARVGVAGRDAMLLPPSLVDRARDQARGLGLGVGRALVIRSGHPAEGRAVAAAVCEAMGRTPLFLDNVQPAGLGAWLHLADLVPVFTRRLAPSEILELPDIVGYDGPVLAVTGPDGNIQSRQGTALSWSLEIPGAEERKALWRAVVSDDALADELATVHRHGPGRIAELGRLAGQHAAIAGREVATRADVHAAAWHGDGGGLAALAQPLPHRVEDDALVLPQSIRGELELVLARCRQRESLSDGLGPAMTNRYRTGVRSLFVGPSGTGKTLAASWLATRLMLPLYRVDMASVVSKYIGETEKNLAELLARAEAAEVVLFFDEADTMFGKRTEVRHSTDRFANAQTNYLLQRIEAYDGIVVLASNSRGSFDPSFSRRLDMILEFPTPSPEQRKELWQVHLGENHSLEPRELNELAIRCDLAGGHVRNAVLCAAVIAMEADTTLGWEQLLAGLRVEYRKIGRALPVQLSRRSRKGRTSNT